MRKQTKVVATISDKNCEIDFIKDMIDRGVDVFRLNTAHQTLKDSLRVIKNIRAVSNFTGILIDTKGPEIRTSGITNDIEVKTGDRIAFSNEDCNTPMTKEGIIIVPVNHEDIVADVPENAMILIDDGKTAFRVIGKEKAYLYAITENGGIIQNKKSINIPGIHLNLPALTDKDRSYIRFAAENNIDFIAHSFVRNADDIEEINEILRDYKSHIKIIAKIENREGVENSEEILNACYGIMVARGDLGIEIPAEDVPVIQKRLIKQCMEQAKPVIIATHMLQSMIENPRPTRAEVSDVANAVLDGSSALMLSGETAYGKYPLDSVETMVRIARASEESRRGIWKHGVNEEADDVRRFLVKTAIEASEKLPIEAIVVHTYSGLTARLVSSFRGGIPIYVRCHDLKIARELTLSYGLYPELIDLPGSTDDLISSSVKPLLEKEIIKKNDLILVLAARPPLSTNECSMIEINTTSKFII